MHVRRNERLIYAIEVAFALAVAILWATTPQYSFTVKAYCLAFMLGAILIVSLVLLGYRRDKYYLRAYVSRLVISCALMVAIICFALGLLLGYTHSSFPKTASELFGIFLSTALVAVETEILRYVIFRSYCRHKTNVAIFTTITVIMNILLVLSATSFVSFEATYITLCTAFLPIIATELLCSYLCLNAGLQPALIYKLIARLYPFVLPFLPNLGHFLYAVVALMLPALIFLLTRNLLLGNLKNQGRIKRRNRVIVAVPIVIAFVVVISLVSGIFKYQIIAIASDSMIPTFERGDAVILEKCPAVDIKEDDILIFKHEGIVITHRVVHTRKNGNSRQFITRGDHNENEDPFVVEESQVVGRVLIINKFIGFPTVWLNELFRAKQS